MTDVYVIQGDVTTIDVDAIVNSANNDLILGAGVSGAIRRVGGPKIQEECNQIGTVPLGTAAITTAGDMRCAWIIHAAVLPLGMWADEKSVRNASKHMLRLANEKGIKSIAIPAVGAGAGAFPIDLCADVLMEAVKKHVEGETSLETVIFILYDEKLLEIFQEHFKTQFPDRNVDDKPETIPRAFPAGAPTGGSEE